MRDRRATSACCSKATTGWTKTFFLVKETTTTATGPVRVGDFYRWLGPCGWDIRRQISLGECDRYEEPRGSLARLQICYRRFRWANDVVTNTELGGRVFEQLGTEVSKIVPFVAFVDGVIELPGFVQVRSLPGEGSK